MKRFIPIFPFIFFLMLLPGTVPAAPVGSFTRIEGSVDILSAGARTPVPANPGDPVSMGDAIRTKRGGKAEIRFMDDSLIQLGPVSRLVVDEYFFGSNQSRERGVLSLLRGKVRAIVSKLKGSVQPVGTSDSGFNIKTPTAVAGVKGTDFVVYYQRGITGIVFLEGAGFAYNPERPDKVVVIQGGQAAFVPSAASAPTNAQPVSSAIMNQHRSDTGADHTSSSGQQSGGGPRGTVVHAIASSEPMDIASLPKEMESPVVVQTGSELERQEAPEAPSFPEKNPELLPARVLVRVPLP